MNKWQPVIKLALAMLFLIMALYYGFSYMGSMIIKRNKEKMNIGSSRPIDFLRKRNPPNPQYLAFVKETEKLEFRRDPFFLEKVVVEEVVKEGPLVLQGIMWEDGAHPKAMINGEVTEIGSFVDHFMVMDILKEKVILMDNDPKVPQAERKIQLMLS